MADAWRSLADRPPFDEQPQRQWVYVEGWRCHSGAEWLRQNVGMARIDPNGPQGYRAEDLALIFADSWSDMDIGSMRVVAWMPYRPPAFPTQDEVIAFREADRG